MKKAMLAKRIYEVSHLTGNFKLRSGQIRAIDLLKAEGLEGRWHLPWNI